jgi:putative peptidoglycan lipid II flippase
MMAPVGVVGQAVGAALLPSLTALVQRDDRTGFGALLTTTLRATLGLSVLAAGALFVLSRPIVTLLYEHGRFTEANSSEVAGLLTILAFAVPGWVLQQVAVRGFYARGEMWRAMTLSTVIALVVFPLYVWGGDQAGIRGLALASATAITANSIITVVWLRLRSGAPTGVQLIESLGRAGVIALAAVAASAGLLRFLNGHTSAPILLLIGGGLIYGVVSLVGVRFLGDAPLREAVVSTLSRLRRR